MARQIDLPDIGEVVRGILQRVPRERRVEALYPTAASIQNEILGRNPDLTSMTGSLFSAYPLGQQFILQARGERFGAATWRSFAQGEQSPEARKVFLDCAVLGEESAAFLESISGGQA